MLAGAMTCNFLTRLFTSEIPSSATMIPGPTITVVGDLGFRAVYGMVRDSVTGNPIANAAVSLQHFSYIRPGSAQTTTDAEGRFTFGEVFLHDTDNMIIQVVADGYTVMEIRRAGLDTYYNPVFDFELESAED